MANATQDKADIFQLLVDYCYAADTCDDACDQCVPPRFLRSWGVQGQWPGFRTIPDRECPLVVRADQTYDHERLPHDYLTCNMTGARVLARETLADRRVVSQANSMVAGNLHFMYEIWEKGGRPDAMIPPHFPDIWDEYVHRVENLSLPPRSRFRQVHEGHATYLVEEERRFVTPAGIRVSCVVGRPEEIVAQLGEMEAVGMKEVALLPPAEHAQDVP